MKKLFIIGIAALLLVVFTVPAMAKVKIGGIIFTDFFYLNRDKENSKYYSSNTGGTGVTSYNNTAIQLPNITRMYARWTNEDNVGMYIEFGVGQNAGAVRFQTDQGDGLYPSGTPTAGGTSTRCSRSWPVTLPPPFHP